MWGRIHSAPADGSGGVPTGFDPVGNRHDPCIVHRAVPVIEAAAALAACELLGI